MNIKNTQNNLQPANKQESMQKENLLFLFPSSIGTCLTWTSFSLKKIQPNEL